HVSKVSYPKPSVYPDFLSDRFLLDPNKYDNRLTASASSRTLERVMAVSGSRHGTKTVAITSA
ncbi:hypothetical protein, partial [Acetobacter syzygii]|uniref:hypothetical protein n=1 Tax=Acetobacter syzygii TaxID=146476 RepID=UPI0039ED9960